MNRNSAATIPGPLPPRLVMMARMTMDMDIPAAPNSISCRRPNFSIVKTAIHEAIKYSVPLAAARILEVNPLRWISF